MTNDSCAVCYGTGAIHCNHCGGTAINHDSGLLNDECRECKGTGNITCHDCRGTGEWHPAGLAAASNR